MWCRHMVEVDTEVMAEMTVPLRAVTEPLVKVLS
jgi:hypothetical protein